MRIVEKSMKKKKVDFKDLNAKDCFRWEDSVYIKINRDQCAIDLADGCMVDDMCGHGVTPVNAEVHIID